MGSRREEVRIAGLEEKVCVKGAGESGEEVAGNHRHYRKAERVGERVEERKAGGRQAGRGELPCSRGTMELNPTAVRTYYQKRNNSELGALPWLLSSEPTSH